MSIQSFHTATSFVRSVYSAAKANGLTVNLFANGAYAKMLRLRDDGYSPAQVAYKLKEAAK